MPINNRSGIAGIVMLALVLAIALAGGIAYVHYVYLPQMNGAEEALTSTSTPVVISTSTASASSSVAAVKKKKAATYAAQPAPAEPPAPTTPTLPSIVSYIPPLTLPSVSAPSPSAPPVQTYAPPVTVTTPPPASAPSTPALVAASGCGTIYDKNRITASNGTVSWNAEDSAMVSCLSNAFLSCNPTTFTEIGTAKTWMYRIEGSTAGGCIFDYKAITNDQSKPPQPMQCAIDPSVIVQIQQ